MRLVLANKQADAGIGFFKDVFSNPVIRNNDKLKGSPVLIEKLKQANSEYQIV